MARKLDVITDTVRRNRVPEVVSMETSRAKGAKKREVVTENRPSMSARDPSRPVAHPMSLPEVLNEIKWDEGLGDFVRISGNRRWRKAVSPESLEGIELYSRALDTERDVRDARERLNVYPNDASLMQMYDHANFVSNTTWQEYRTWSRRHPDLVGRAGTPDSEAKRLVVEDRQPDGTWAPAVDQGVNANSGESAELPLPPPEQPVMAAKGGETRADDKGDDADKGAPSGHNPALDGYSGPRIVVNPSTFENEKDAACVAWNEAFRIIMEDMNFEPQAEPTDTQREFFSDTAYADDELMLRRTILARICVFDTSVENPTDEQIQEAVEFLQNVLEAGYPQTEEEQRNVKRILDVLSAVPTSNGRSEPAGPTMDVTGSMLPEEDHRK